MKQMQATDASELLWKLLAQAITVVVTGVTPLRRMFIRIIVLVAIAVGAVSFAVGVMLRDYLPDNLVPSVQSTVTDPSLRPPIEQQLPPPPRNNLVPSVQSTVVDPVFRSPIEQQPPPSSRKPPSDEELRRLIKPNPL